MIVLSFGVIGVSFLGYQGRHWQGFRKKFSTPSLQPQSTRRQALGEAWGDWVKWVENEQKWVKNVYKDLKTVDSSRGVC